MVEILLIFRVSLWTAGLKVRLDFEIWFGGKQAQLVPREKGDVIVFPAFCMHRVTPITRGERRCLVFWTGGRPFR